MTYPRVHIVTEHSRETGIHPCGHKNPPQTTETDTEVTCVPCQHWLIMVGRDFRRDA